MNYIQKKSVYLLLLLLLAGCANKGQNSSSVCTIRGEIIGRPESKTLLLRRAGEDFRTKADSVPIVDGKFEYHLTFDHLEAWEFAFAEEVSMGSYMYDTFFSENDTIRMRLYPQDEWEKNEISGGKLTQEYIAYMALLKGSFDYTPLGKEWDELYQSDEAFNERAKELQKSARNATDKAEKDKYYTAFYKLRDANEHYSEKGKALHEKSVRFFQEVVEWEIQYLAKHVSIPSYFRLCALLSPARRSTVPDNSGLADLYHKVYANAYPDHPYTKQIETLLLAQSLRPGEKYIDFTAPDFEGRPVTLSTQIAGKIALIDLWASWCGPCRRFSKSMIPVYEKYKDKGFTIVGVARESKAENGIRAARKDGFPWLNLLEVEDAANIWNLYGIGNAGGAAFLVDRDGTFLAVHPTIEEVEKILNEKLGMQ